MNEVSMVEVVLFTKHLSIMIQSGVPILEAMEILSEQTKNKAMKAVLIGVEAHIRNGSTLVSALTSYPRVFSPFYVSLITVGEQSGKLEEVLAYLADHLKKQYSFKKKVQSALLYPEIILITALLVGAGISLFVLPQLIDLFESLQVKLPFSTQLLLGAAHFMKLYGVMFFTSLFVFIGLIRALIKTSLVRPYWDRFLFSLPLIGSYLNTIELASFCRSLGMMLKSGMPILASFDKLETSTENTIYKKSLHEMKSGIKQGGSLYKTIQHNQISIFPLIASRMIQVGEKTGKLDEVLLYLGDFFEEEIDANSKDFSTVLEPVILVVVGLIVAYLAFAIITPIYEFTSVIK